MKTITVRISDGRIAEMREAEKTTECTMFAFHLALWGDDIYKATRDGESEVTID
jgi:hypothetical protein